MNYAVKQRLVMIEFLLQQYGHVGRAELIEFFGISPAAATRDFCQYKEMAGRNLAYSETEKRYYKTQNFQPVFIGR